VRRILIVLIVLVTTLAGAVGTLGVLEPSRRLTDTEPLWFAAVAGDPAALAPADGVSVRWSARSEFALVGAAGPAWTGFALLAGEAEGAPVRLGAGVEDAWIARVHPVRPPVFVLGALRAAHLLGLTRRGPDPEGPPRVAERDDAALLPTPAAIAELRARPADFRPAMVNFLAYRDADAYARYGAVALRTVYGLGGQLQFLGRVGELVRASTRDPDAHWDDVAAMRYPDPTAILTMEQDPAYRASLDDRAEGLEATRVIATTVTHPD
jgi:uncharacterized protein (DUF1330 family)